VAAHFEAKARESLDALAPRLRALRAVQEAGLHDEAHYQNELYGRLEWVGYDCQARLAILQHEALKLRREHGRQLAGLATPISRHAGDRTTLAGPEELHVGLAVEVRGLVGATEHNGKQGVVASCVGENGRCSVRLPGRAKPLGLKPANLALLPMAQGPDYAALFSTERRARLDASRGSRRRCLMFFTPRMAEAVVRDLEANLDPDAAEYVDGPTDSPLNKFDMDDHVDDTWFSDMPPCVHDLFRAKGAFYWRYIDCYEALIQRIMTGASPLPHCVGESIVLHFCLKRLWSKEIRARGSDFDGEPMDFGAAEMAFGQTLDPRALLEPAALLDWAPVPIAARVRQTALLKSMAPLGSYEMYSDESFRQVDVEDEIKDENAGVYSDFRRAVRSPWQVRAETSDFSRLDQWYRDFSEFPEDSRYGSPNWKPSEYSNIDGVIPLAALSRLLPALPLYRRDGATLHIAVSPVPEGEMLHEGSILPWIQVKAFIRVPAEVAPVGCIDAIFMQRSCGHGEVTREDAWVSFDEMVLQIEEEADSSSHLHALSMDLLLAAVRKCLDCGARSSRLRPGLKQPPCALPSSSDVGPLALIRKVEVEPPYRGGGLGLDALAGLLRTLDWTLAAVSSDWFASDWLRMGRLAADGAVGIGSRVRLCGLEGPSNGAIRHLNGHEALVVAINPHCALHRVRVQTPVDGWVGPDGAPLPDKALGCNSEVD
jgi:hypothetical protein